MGEKILTNESLIEEKGFKRVELRVKEPDRFQEYEIVFESDSGDLCAVYNFAISEISKEENLGLIHQIESGNEPGTHAWEFFGIKR